MMILLLLPFIFNLATAQGTCQAAIICADEYNKGTPRCGGPPSPSTGTLDAMMRYENCLCGHEKIFDEWYWIYNNNSMEKRKTSCTGTSCSFEICSWTRKEVAPAGCNNFSPCNEAVKCAEQMSIAASKCGNPLSVTNSFDLIKQQECQCGISKAYSDW